MSECLVLRALQTYLFSIKTTRQQYCTTALTSISLSTQLAHISHTLTERSSFHNPPTPFIISSQINSLSATVSIEYHQFLLARPTNKRRNNTRHEFIVLVFSHIRELHDLNCGEVSFFHASKSPTPVAPVSIPFFFIMSVKEEEDEEDTTHSGSNLRCNTTWSAVGRAAIVNIYHNFSL